MSRAMNDTLSTTVSGALACLEDFSARLSGAHLACTPCPACDGSMMLVVESGDGNADDPATWIVTLAPGGRLALEAVIDETRLEILAIGPADRILTLLRTLSQPVAVDA
jgi:hypothetical protein